MQHSRDAIRRKAAELLNNFRVRRPPVDVHRIALGLGAQVQFAPSQDELSGFLLRDPQTESVVIGVNARHNELRRRFTIAHELGHLLLHRQEGLHLDRRGSGFEVHTRDHRSSQGTDRREMEANAFAAELLMPASFLDADLTRWEWIDLSDDGVLKMLANRYSVSPTAMTFRLAKLGYIELLP